MPLIIVSVKPLRPDHLEYKQKQHFVSVNIGTFATGTSGPINAHEVSIRCHQILLFSDYTGTVFFLKLAIIAQVS